MHRRLFLFAATIAVSTGAARAQNPSTPSTVAQPSTPAPVVVTTPSQPANPSSAPATREPQSPTQGVAAAPAQSGITQTVYTPKLPTAQELTDAAAAQGLSVERISQTSLQVIAFYRTANGQSLTVAYQTLPPAAVAQTPAPPVVVSAPPTVVYESAPRVIYYDAPPYYYPGYYYPGYWYPPVSFSFGFGFRGGHYHRR